MTISLGAYSGLPDKVPTHWGPSGEPDAYGPKASVFLFPGILVFLFALFFLIPKIEPYRENIREFKKEYMGIFLILMIFMLALQVVTIIQSFSPFNMNLFIIPFMALLFFYIGTIMPRFKRNFFVGVRTPWTLASGHVWEKTHEMGGRVFKIMGILTLLSMFLGKQAVLTFTIFVLGGALFIVVYSFWVFRRDIGVKIDTEGKKPL